MPATNLMAMMGNRGWRLRAAFLLPLLIPVLGGWSVGLFLREIQASIVPYQQFLLVGSLAGHVQFTPPSLLHAACQVAVPLIWLVWSLLFHRWRAVPVAEALQLGGWSYLPLLVLPVVVLVVEFESLRFLKWVLDAMLLTAVAAVCAGKAWLWSGRCPPVPPEQGTAGSRWV